MVSGRRSRHFHSAANLATPQSRTCCRRITGCKRLPYPMLRNNLPYTLNRWEGLPIRVYSRRCISEDNRRRFPRQLSFSAKPPRRGIAQLEGFLQTPSPTRSWRKIDSSELRHSGRRPFLPTARLLSGDSQTVLHQSESGPRCQTPHSNSRRTRPISLQTLRPREAEGRKS